MELFILSANHPYLWINIKGARFSSAIDINPELNFVFIICSIFGPVQDGSTNFSVLPAQPVGTKNISSPPVSLVVDRPNLHTIVRG